MHKLIVDDFLDSDYVLFAIHTSLIDYRLAYLLNCCLNINLKRRPKDLDFKYIQMSYPIFEWKDLEQLKTWNLVSNICIKEEESIISTGSLFNNTTKLIKKHTLIPEFKTANFLLKMSSNCNVINPKTIITNIQKIVQIALVYPIDLNQIKSKTNLIFN